MFFDPATHDLDYMFFDSFSFSIVFHSFILITMGQFVFPYFLDSCSPLWACSM